MNPPIPVMPLIRWQALMADTGAELTVCRCLEPDHPVYATTPVDKHADYAHIPWE